MNNKRILNYSMVVAYTFLLLALAAGFELALFKVPAPTGLVRISEGMAEVGFSVTVIAVSILAVITNISERRFFGIKAGEYLKFRRREYTPGFYDVLVIIVLMGALQYAGLAFDFRYAAFWNRNKSASYCSGFWFCQNRSSLLSVCRPPLL